MSKAPPTKSDKLHLIDRATYDKISQQQQTTATTTPDKIIRNSKYKKTRTTFNLFYFLIQKPKKSPGERHKSKLKRKCTVGSKDKNIFKKRGKVREGGCKKPTSRLKKSILRYRQQKRLQEQLQQQHFTEALNQLDGLTLNTSPTTNTLNSAPTTSTNSGIHSRRFRVYCDNTTTPLLCKLTEQLLRELNRFQRRAYAQNEIKARAHRRFVIGFREVQNFLNINKVKLTIIAPDCEECKGEAGLEETIDNIKTKCQHQQVPYSFSLQRRQLAYALYKKVPISCVGILDYDGARDIFTQLIEALQEAKQSYEKLLQS